MKSVLPSLLLLLGMTACDRSPPPQQPDASTTTCNDRGRAYMTAKAAATRCDPSKPNPCEVFRPSGIDCDFVGIDPDAKDTLEAVASQWTDACPWFAIGCPYQPPPAYACLADAGVATCTVVKRDGG